MEGSREGGRAPNGDVATPADVPGGNRKDGSAAAPAPDPDPLLAALERRGAWFLVRRAYRRVRMTSSLLLDELLGVETTPVDDVLSPHRPAGWLTLWRVFRRLHRTADGGVVLDVGSGAGRAVLMASMFPFRRVIGLELLELMHRLAGDNLGRFRLHRRAEVQLVLGDASRYEMPDDVTAVFLYNSFGGTTFARWTERLFDSLDRSPRRLTIAYLNPVEHEYLLRTGRCRLVGRFRGLRPSARWARTLATHFYEVRPSQPLERDAAGGAVRAG